MCTDVTHLKELEKQGKVMRAKFFSSVAHELRTPLNSMIPVLKLVLTIVLQASTLDVPRVSKLLKIVYNSA